MNALSIITWFLIHIVIWIVCLVAIIPASVILWVLLKDLFNNDAKKIKREAGRILMKAGLIVESHTTKKTKKIPIDPNKRPSKNEDDVKESKMTVDEEEKRIIYLDKHTSITAAFPEEQSSIKID